MTMTRPRGSVFIATSLDGFIAREDGGIDWLLRANEAAPKGEDFGYAEFFASVGALVMGRKTYDLVQTFGEWPYGDKRVIVLSRGHPEIPDALASRVEATAEDPAALLARLGAAGVERVYVDGGLTIQSFLRAGLVDDLTITTIPVLLGSGIPLFGRLERDLDLELVSTRSWECGFVQCVYRVLR